MEKPKMVPTHEDDCESLDIDDRKSQSHLLLKIHITYFGEDHNIFGREIKKYIIA